MRIREILNRILADSTGQTIERIKKDTDRNYYMSAEESLSYGIIDEIISKSFSIEKHKKAEKNE